MDNSSDFQFLAESFATPFNKEYVIIRTYPVVWKLYVAGFSVSREKAISIKELSNLGTDSCVFSLRVKQHGKLWTEDGKISQVQDWQVHHDYIKTSRDLTTDGEITTCDCSYPLFTALGTHLNAENEPTEYWYYITCLEDDNGRQIDTCPNCGKTLQDDEESEDDHQLIACVGCKHYHGEIYNDIILICAMHPNGNKENTCPDWEN